MCSATNTNTSKNCSNCSAQLAMKAECETSCSPQLSLYRPTIWNQAFIIQLFLSWSRWERLGGCEIIAYNVDDRVLMMKGFELGEKKWNPWQLHCLLNLDNLSPADGKINWKWISKAEIEIQGIQTGVKWKYAWGSCPQILSSLSRKISIGRSSCTEC